MKKTLVKIAVIISAVFLVVMLTSCPPVSGSVDDSNPPSINNPEPLSFEIGDIVTINGEPIGIVFHIDENSGKTSGKILSLNKYKSQFCDLYTNACSSSYASNLVALSSRTDGQANYDLWCRLLPDFSGNSHYNAWYWCKTEKGNDWYIPAIDEITEIVSNSIILEQACTALVAEGYEASLFSKKFTWSSTPRGLVTDVNPSRIALYFSNNQSSMICNENDFYVQPVRTFNTSIDGIGKYKRSPKFTSFEIPTVSKTKQGVRARAKVTGKNFSDSNFSVSQLRISASNYPSLFSDVKYSIVGDKTLFIDFTIPSVSGNYQITLSYETESINGTLKVKDSVTYPVGSVLLDDGSIIKYNANNLAFTDNQKNRAIGVVCGENNYGIPLVLGKNNSASGQHAGSYAWAISNSQARSTLFTSLVCTPQTTGTGTAATAVFTGDLNGSDNWDYIKAFYQTEASAAHPESPESTNYPAFYYIVSYPNFFILPEQYSKGWYMPAISELYSIYQNKEILNGVLSALGGVQIGQYNYWSSSQSGSNAAAAWTLRMSDGLFVGLGKQVTSTSTYTTKVCCVRPIE